MVVDFFEYCNLLFLIVINEFDSVLRYLVSVVCDVLMLFVYILVINVDVCNCRLVIDVLIVVSEYVLVILFFVGG